MISISIMLIILLRISLQIKCTDEIDIDDLHFDMVSELRQACSYPCTGLSAQLYYKNKNGDDLLSSKTQGYFKKDGITVSNIWIKNDGTKLVLPASIFQYNSCDSLVCLSQAGHSINFLLGNSLSNNGSAFNSTLVYLNSSTIDTLTYETLPMNAGFGVSKVLYKGNVIWSSSPTYTTNMIMTITR